MGACPAIWRVNWDKKIKLGEVLRQAEQKHGSFVGRRGGFG